MGHATFGALDSNTAGMNLIAFWWSCLDLWSSPQCVACAECAPDARPLCALCRGGLSPSSDPPDGVTAPYDHGGPLMRAVHRAKYGDDPGLARALGALLVPHVSAWRGDIDAVIPVPLHPARLRSRGFNQSHELARPVARALDARLWPDAVERVRDTGTQTARSREARHDNVRGAFSVRRVAALRGARVLLVDDVVTTGATLFALRDAALDAGAREARGLTLTRMAKWLA